MEPRVVQADNAGLFTLGGTRTHLVGHREVAVIDPGPADRSHLDRLLGALSEAGQISVLLTHFHSDHWEGTLPLVEALRGRADFASGRGWIRVLGPQPPARAPLPPGLSLLIGQGLWVSLGHGDEVTTDQGRLRALWTPGHAEAHLAFEWLPCRSVFPGDLLMGEGETVWVAGYPSCVGDYLASLDRLQATGARSGHPAHGAPIGDLPEAIRRFRAHRMARLRQVEALHREDPTLRPRSMIRRVYGEALPPERFAAAEESLRAMMAHLGILRSPPRGVPESPG